MATTTPVDTTQDRRRTREQRGVQSTKAANAASDRLPPPPRERRPALAALAVLLIVGGAAIAGLLALRADSRVPVVVAAETIPAGAQITASSLATTRVAAEDTMLIPASQLDQLVGRYARAEIVSGQLIDTSMVVSSGMLSAPDSVAVGATLAPGRMPAAGLRQGDIVDIVQVTGEGQVVVSGARVGSVQGGGDGAAGATGATVTLFVNRADAPRVSTVAADGDLALVLIERDAPIAPQED